MYHMTCPRPLKEWEEVSAGALSSVRVACREDGNSVMMMHDDEFGPLYRSMIKRTAKCLGDGEDTFLCVPLGCHFAEDSSHRLRAILLVIWRVFCIFIGSANADGRG